MKRTLRTGHADFGSAFRRFGWFPMPMLAAVASCALPLGLVSAPVSTEPKTHELFMGADILVEHDQKFLRVQDVVGGSFVVRVDGREVKVPADWVAIKIKVDRALKLTGTVVTVDHLKVERAYTSANDPTKKFMRQQGGVQAAQAAVASQQVKLESTNLLTNVMTHGQTDRSVAPELGFKVGDPVALERGMNDLGREAQAEFGRASGQVSQMYSEVAAEEFDAIDVSCEIFCGKEIRKPYVVLLAQYRSPGAKPGEAHNWVYAAALEPLGSATRRFNVRTGGFPPGFTLEKYQVHVYDGGQELGTNMAEKQVPLTKTEAFTYLLIDYLGTHKGASLPAKPAMGKLPAEAQTRLSAEQLNQPYYVKVTKDGLPVAAYLDTGCLHPADDEVGRFVENVRFYPALENGNSVAGVAELKFGRLNL